MQIGDTFQNLLLQGGLATAFFTLIAQSMWALGRRASDAFRLNVLLRPRREPLVLQCKYKEIKNIAEFYVLIVSYGSDSYLNSLASPNEKSDGRRRLSIKRCTCTHDEDGNALLTVPIRIHPTLGTQFKIFAQPKSGVSVNAVVQMLKETEERGLISDVKVSDSAYKTRVYFLVESIAKVPTVEAIGGTPGPGGAPTVVNNYIYPV